MTRALPVSKPVRAPMDWAPFAALLLLVLVSAYCLAAADWADHLGMVPTVAALAVVAGTALARSRFPGWLAAAFATAYGLFLVTFLAAITIVDVYSIHDQLVALGGRLGAFAAVLASGEPNKDPLMFVVLMMALYWIIGVDGQLLCDPQRPHLASTAASRRGPAGEHLLLPPASGAGRLRGRLRAGGGGLPVCRQPGSAPARMARWSDRAFRPMRRGRSPRLDCCWPFCW